MSEFENPNLPENLPEKRIEVVTMRVGDIKTGFGNPRKIGKKKREELKRSLEQFGDFGLFLIDEQDNVIAGNMSRRKTSGKKQNRDSLYRCIVRMEANYFPVRSVFVRSTVVSVQINFRQRLFHSVKYRDFI